MFPNRTFDYSNLNNLQNIGRIQIQKNLVRNTGFY